MDRHRRLALVACVFLACSTRAAAPPAGPSESGAGVATAGNGDPGRAYELGAGVARDYAAAARLHEKRCADGRGDLVACRKLGLAFASARGVAFDRDRAAWLLTHACRRGDWAACAAYPYGLDEPGAKARKAACERGKVEACAFELAFMVGDGSAAQEHRQDLENRLCRSGSLDGCLAVVGGAWLRCSGPDEARCVAATFALAAEVGTWEVLYARLDAECRGARPASAACTDLETLSESYASVEDIVHAVGRLTAWCDVGDADACEKLPGRAIAPTALCAAADYQACARAAFDDPAAGERACEHGVVDGCLAVARRALEVEPNDVVRAREFFRRACRLGSDDGCTAERDPDLATGCADYRPSRSPAGSREVVADVRGTKVGGGAVELRKASQPYVVVPHTGESWALYADLARLLAPAAQLFVMVDDLTGVPATPGVVLFRRDGGDSAGDWVRFTGGVPKFSPFVVDGRGQIRASLFPPPTGISAPTFSRCVISLLAEP